MLVPKESMRLISARENLGKDSGNNQQGQYQLIIIDVPRRLLAIQGKTPQERKACIIPNQQNLLEQRATGELSPLGPIGTARK